MTFDFSGENKDIMDGFEDFNESENVQNIPVAEDPMSYPEEVDTAQEEVEQLLSQPEEEDYEQVLSQVDRRMRVAHFYRSILDASLFNETTSEAILVQSRIKKYCNEELEKLFGMRAATAPIQQGQFTLEEVDALKAFAHKLLKIEGAQTSKAPVVNRVETKPQPAVNIIQTNKAPTKPPQAPKPVPPTQSKPVQKPSPTKAADPRIPEKYKNDPTARMQNGQLYIQARNDDNELLWVIEGTGKNRTKKPVLKNVTPQYMPPPGSPQPMPSPSMAGGVTSAYSQVMNQQAENTTNWIDKMARNNKGGGILAGGLATILVNKSGDVE